MGCCELQFGLVTVYFVFIIVGEHLRSTALQGSQSPHVPGCAWFSLALFSKLKVSTNLLLFWRLFSMFCVVFLKFVTLFHTLEWQIEKEKEITPFFFFFPLVFFLFRSASESAGILFFCLLDFNIIDFSIIDFNIIDFNMLDFNIIAVFPGKLDAVFTVERFRSRGVGCNTGVTS